MPESLTPEPLQQDTFIGLLNGARDLHLGLLPGESFSGVRVDRHSGSLSILQTGNPREDVNYLVIHETPHNGLMVRRVKGEARADGMVAGESVVLLSTVSDSRYLASREVPVMSRHMDHISHDVEVELNALRRSGEPLQESTARDWLEIILDVDAEHKRIGQQSAQKRWSKVAAMVGRISGRGHSVSGA